MHDRAAIVGLGWWGKTLVEAVQQDSEDDPLRRGHDAHDHAGVQAFADAQDFRLAESYEALLARSEGRRGRAGDAALAARARR